MNKINQINSAEKSKVKEINLKELFQVIKRRLWVIVVITILAGCVGYILNKSAAVPLYQSSSRVIIGTDDQSRATLQVIVKDSTVLDQVVKQLNLKETSDSLANQITVASIDSSQVVSISVVNPNPELAAQIADATAEVFREEVPKIVGKDYVQILSNAKVNNVPINPKTNKKLYTLVIGGFVISIGAAFLLESLDDRIRIDDDIEELLGLPFLGRVSKVNNRNVKRKTNKKKLELVPRGDTVGHK